MIQLHLIWTSLVDGGVYDVELNARLGDLSGLSSGLLYEAIHGFRLFTENVFLLVYNPTTGSFTGKVHVGTTMVSL